MLESKVARVASKKCSMEVTALQQEVERWLMEVTTIDAIRAPSSSAQSSLLTRSHIQSSALYLSSSLLKAIIANHVAFSDASKGAKHAEASLKLKVDKLEHEKGRLEVELRTSQVSYKLNISSGDKGANIFLGRLVVCNSGECTPVLMFLQNVQYNQNIQECQSLRTKLSLFVFT